MSAGSIDYNAIIGKRAKVTLPSVDTWFTDMNILKDPPRGIFTAKKEKVFDTSAITTEQEESGNRACENILVFARGVNPFVSVSYDNFGNNGGKNSAFTPGGQTQAKLPYPILRGGDFRPPLIMPEEKFALSRQPRPWTSNFASRSFADFSKRLRSCGTDQNTREVKADTLHALVEPRPTMRIETPVQEGYEARKSIQNVITNDVSSGIRGHELIDYLSTDPTSGIDENPLHADARTNPSENRYVNESEFDAGKYIQGTLAHDAYTNPSTNCTQIDTMFDLSDMPVKNHVLHISRTTPLSGYNQDNLEHNPIELSRKMASTQAHSNVSDPRVHRSIKHENTILTQRNLPQVSVEARPISRPTSMPEHGSRQARLIPKINPGSFAIPSQVPQSIYVNNQVGNIESQKARMSRLVYQSMHDRNSRQPSS